VIARQTIARPSHPAERSGKAFSLPQTFAAIWTSGIIPPSIIDSEFLERLR
jgi:hypothetical protein